MAAVIEQFSSSGKQPPSSKSKRILPETLCLPKHQKSGKKLLEPSPMYPAVPVSSPEDKAL